MKVCASCGESKEITEFSKERNRKDGIQPYCKPCRKVKRAKYWAGDVGKNKALIKNYGITLEAFNAILAAQGGHCALCARTEDLCLDHCHVTKKIRGVLCRKCNLMLGHADDSVAKLAAAIIYLGK